ncbi:MAG TPA: sigma 54-interacting transcriptional regulator [Isosphaeraceae bacterium]|jgi:transcriptional regulator with PAS, ATPase and Fis domain|nr:sigma 54-interacting transcriptional regulator [Isosphaeraceae bacterium]
MTSPRVSGIRLDTLWQQAREAVFVLNAERRLVYANRAWEELTGHSAQSVQGLACRPHGPTGAGDQIGLGGSFCPPPEALDGQPAGGPTLIVHSGGERRWRRVEFWPYHDEHGQLIFILGLVRNPDAPPHAPDSDGHRLRNELLEVRNRLHGRYGYDSLIGQGPAHRRLLDQVRMATATCVPVLIVGAPGTGKRMVARTIHQQSSRGQSPLLPFDCAALPAEVIERELFGLADESPAPGFRLSAGSSVLLGDILDLPRDLQSRLAAALGADDRVRLLATTASDPDQARLSEQLRADLYFALTTMVISLSPLRERFDDLPLLAQHMLERANIRGGRQRLGFSAGALEALFAYDWPGNLRELARVVDEAHSLGDGDSIQVDDLPAAVRGNLGSAYSPPPMPPPITPLDDLLTQLERRLIEQALTRARQNKSRAAELLDISRPRLYRRIRELNIPDEGEPTDDGPVHSRKAAVVGTGAAPATSLPPKPSQS